MLHGVRWLINDFSECYYYEIVVTIGSSDERFIGNLTSVCRRFWNVAGHGLEGTWLDTDWRERGWARTGGNVAGHGLEGTCICK